MDFITLADTTDEIVTCTQADVDQANSFLMEIANRMLIKEVEIITPVAFTTKRLGIVYALYIAAVRDIGKDNLTSLNTESVRMDIYAQKAKLFKEELDKLEKEIRASDFTGKELGNFATMRMWYGGY